MPQSSHIFVTSAGINNINTSNLEPIFAIKYFLPLYDQRVDPNIHTDPLSNETSAIYTSGANVEPLNHDTMIGEKLFNLENSTSAYSFSLNSDFVYNIDGASTSTSGITDTTQSQSTFINLLNGLPMSDVVSGDSPEAIGGGDFTFESSILSASGAPDAIPSVDREYLYDQVRYNPVTSGSGSIRGTFKCVIPNSVGDFKFNKIALYLQRLDNQGNIIIGSDPLVFGVVTLNQVVTKSKFGSSNTIQQFELDVELDFFLNTSGGTNTAFFTTDDWVRVPIGLNPSSATQGLFFANDVAIGTSAGGDGSWNARAHLHVTDDQKAQLRLSNNYDLNAADFLVDSDGLLNIDTSASNHSLVSLGSKPTTIAICLFL